MAKRWKLIRTMLSAEGYTSVNSAEGITFQSIDADGLIHWTDSEGVQHESFYDGESVSTTITITAPENMAIGVTVDLIAENDMGDNITSTVTFTSGDPDVVSVSGYTITAESAGTTTITARVGDISESISIIVA